MYKRAQGAAVSLLIIIVIIILVIWVSSCERGECRQDSDCADNNYCGADKACHQIPIINQTVVQYNLTLPSLIIGVAIVIAAIILRRKRPPKQPKKPQKENNFRSRGTWSQPYRPKQI